MVRNTVFLIFILSVCFNLFSMKRSFDQISNSHENDSFQISLIERAKEVMDKINTNTWQNIDFEALLNDQALLQCLNNNYKVTLLHIAALGQPQAISVWLKNIALEAKSSNGATPLHWAACFNAESLNLLLAQGADKEAKNNNGSTPLHLAARFNADSLKLLLNQDADKEAKDNDGRTPLHYAARFNAESLKILLEQGSDKETKDNSGSTPLHYAAQNNAESVKLLLAQNADKEANDNKGRTPLHYAVNNNAESVKLLLAQGSYKEAQDKQGATPLHAAALHNAESVKLLLAHGADIEAKDTVGVTPLHYAAKFYAETIKLLLAQGADIDAKDNNDQTPLHGATQYNNFDAIKILLDNAANIESEDINGRIPLAYINSNGNAKSNIMKPLRIYLKHIKLKKLHSPRILDVLMRKAINVREVPDNYIDSFGLSLFDAGYTIDALFLFNRPKAVIYLNILFYLFRFYKCRNLSEFMYNFESGLNLSSNLSARLESAISLASMDPKISEEKNEYTKVERLKEHILPIVYEEANQLIKAGTPLNVIDLYDNRLIDYAVMSGDKSLLGLLIYCGAKVDYKTIIKFIESTEFELLKFITLN